MKKIVSVLIAISIILSGMAVNVSAVEEVLVKESFEDTLSSSVWTGGYEITDGINKSITSSSNGTDFNCRLNKSVESGAMIVSYDVMIPNYAAIRIKQVWDDAGERAYLIKSTTSGKITIENTELCPYTPGQWYNISEVVDVTEKTVDVYINGKHIDKYDWRENKEASGICYIQTQYDSNEIYVDNAYIASYTDKASADAALSAMLTKKISLEKSSFDVAKNTTVTNAVKPITSGAEIISYDISGNPVGGRLMQIYDNTLNVNARTALVAVNSSGIITVNNSSTEYYWDSTKTNNVSLVFDAVNVKFSVYYNGIEIAKDKATFNGGCNIARIDCQSGDNAEFTVSNAWAMGFESFANAQEYIKAKSNFEEKAVQTYYGISLTDAKELISQYARGISAISCTLEQESKIVSEMSRKYPGIKIFSEDFNKYAVSSAPTGYMVADNAIVMENRSVELSYNSGRGRLLKSSAITNQSFITSADFMQTQTSNIDCLMRITDSTGTKEVVKVYTKDQNIMFTYGNSEGQTIAKTLLEGYENDTWYNIMVLSDIEDKTFKIYIQNECFENSSFNFVCSDMTDFDRVFDSYTSSENTKYYIDNIDVYSFGGGASSHSYIWREKFSDKADGYEILTSDGYVAASNAFVENGALKIINVGNGRSRLLKQTNAATKAFKVSFDFMQDELSNITCLARTSNADGNHAAFVLYTENGNIGVNYNAHQEGVSREIIYEGYKAGEWYNIEYYVNLDTKTFSINVNGEPCSNSNLEFLSDFVTDYYNLNRIFDTYNENKGVYYIDNIAVYGDYLYDKIFPITIKDRIAYDMMLPVPLDDSANYTWSASVSGIVDNGMIVRPEETTNVVLTLTASDGVFSSKRKYNVKIMNNDDVAAAITTAMNALNFPEVLASPIVIFPKSPDEEVEIEWSCSPEGVIDADGNVQIPVDNDVNITLKATLSYTNTSVAEQTKDFNVTIKSVLPYVVSDAIYETNNGNETRSAANASNLKKVYVDKMLDKTALLISASYNENGRLLDVKKTKVVDGFNEVNFDLPEGTYNVKNFVWDDLNNLNPLAIASELKNDDITCWMIGDSMMATYDPKKTTRVGWGQIFGNYFDESHVTVRNENAHPGYALKSSLREGCLNSILKDIEQGDYVVISFGHNDSHSYNPFIYLTTETGGGYQQYITKYVDAVRLRGAQPILVTSIERCIYDKDGKPTNSLAEYARSMKEIAGVLNVPVIDVNTMTNKYLTEVGYNVAKNRYMIDAEGDVTHLNGEGAAWVCEYVAEQLRELNIPISDYLK